MVHSIANVGNFWQSTAWANWAPQAVAHGEDQGSPAGGELTDTACQIKNTDPQIAGDVS